jgi:hypothetical protein
MSPFALVTLEEYRIIKKEYEDAHQAFLDLVEKQAGRYVSVGSEESSAHGVAFTRWRDAELRLHLANCKRDDSPREQACGKRITAGPQVCTLPAGHTGDCEKPYINYWECPNYKKAFEAAQNARALPLPPGADADLYLYDVAKTALGENPGDEYDLASLAAEAVYKEMKRSGAHWYALYRRARPELSRESQRNTPARVTGLPG